MPEPNDIVRLRKDYAERELKFSQEAYSLFNKSNLFTIQQRQRAVLRVLKKNGFDSLRDYSILEIGCGNGNVLQECLAFGALPQNLFGVDLLEDRLKTVGQTVPGLAFLCGDGRHLPFSDHQFDLIFQFTMFTSILDQGIKSVIAQEMTRVLNQPRGMILWYDFWLNPTNPHTRGIRPSEIKILFPQCSFQFYRITLAPPLTRRVIPISWVLGMVLEKLKIFNSHYLVSIKPTSGETKIGTQ